MRLLIKNAAIADATAEYQEGCDILLEEGIIKEIGRDLKAEEVRQLDCQGLTVLPGLVDLHSHLREPGYEHKETVASGTRAAARGGFTTICCMPNTKPVIDEPAKLKHLLELIKKDAVVKVLPMAAISMGQQSEKLTDMKALAEMGAAAFSDDGQPVRDNGLMLAALEAAKQIDALIMDHCEDHSLVNGGVINKGYQSQALRLKGISALSEELPIMRDILLAQEAGYKIHIAHVSTKGAVEIIREAKEKGIRVTCEVTPHHIAMDESMLEEGFTDCKVNPPLRSKEDVAAIKAGLKDGTIDAIATDHAPHHQTEKGGDFYTAANGISGIETAFAVCYTELVEHGVLSLKELTAKMSRNPAIILGMDAGCIAVGKAADLTIVDLNKEITIDKNTFLSKGKNTPFHGRRCKGEVIYTIVNGKMAYQKEEKQ
jgi:dihydroorotase